MIIVIIIMIIMMMMMCVGQRQCSQTSSSGGQSERQSVDHARQPAHHGAQRRRQSSKYICFNPHHIYNTNDVYIDVMCVVVSRTSRAQSAAQTNGADSTRAEATAQGTRPTPQTTREGAQGHGAYARQTHRQICKISNL